MATDRVKTELAALDRNLAELWRLYEEMRRTPVQFPPADSSDEQTPAPRDGEAA